MISEKILTGALSYLISAGMGAAVSIITVQVSLGYVEKGFDDYKVSNRYQDELRDRTTTLQYTTLLGRLESIERRLDREPKASLDLPYSYAHMRLVETERLYQPHHKAIPELPPPVRPLIFDEKLAEIQQRIVPLAKKQEKHEISDHEEDILMQAEQHIQRIRLWQAYCEPDPDVRDWCLDHQDELLPE